MESKHIYLAITMFLVGIVLGILLADLSSNISGLAVLDSNNLDSISQPSDYFNNSNFILHENKLTINIVNASISSYSDSGSMLPFLTSYSNGIIIVPVSESDIHVGDIVSFNKQNKTIVHRVVEINSDEQGIYFITQGDNSNSADSMIRFSDIKYKLVGILY